VLVIGEAHFAGVLETMGAALAYAEAAE
jgi:hypothetical protein